MTLANNVFVTDFDKTIAFYDKYDDVSYNDLISLPKSVGTGKVGYIYKNNRELLNELSNNNVTLICASGMRETTMMQRFPTLPFIKYWICENGGKMFILENNVIREIKEWQFYLDKYQETIRDLSVFTSDLINDGWHVDCDGYKHMIRIKISKPNNNIYHDIHSNQKLIEILQSKIPVTLKYTFNLGYMDVCISQIGKYQAVKWLLEFLGLPCEYSFMGDDDNDVEIGSYAQCAYIVEPCSDSMRAWIESRNSTNELSNVVLSNTKGHLGANFLLNLAHNKFRNNIV